MYIKSLQTYKNRYFFVPDFKKQQNRFKFGRFACFLITFISDLQSKDDKKMNKDMFQLFEKLMDEESIYIDRSLNFSGICKIIGADQAALDAYIREELGYSGEEVLETYRKQYRQKLLQKYGVKI